MKRPNGYGAVINLGKGRRRPYAVRVTDEAKSAIKNADGSYTQKFTYIGYFEKKSDAFEALEAFQASKAPVSYAKITFGEVWELWAERNLDEKSKSRTAAYKAAIKKCDPIAKRAIADLRLADLQKIVDEHEGASLSALNQLKIVMSFCFEWAIKNDIIEKDYAKFVEIRPRAAQNHIPLTHTEVEKLKALKCPDFFEKTVLLFLYTGVRPKELLTLPIENVHLDEKYFEITQAKTKSGLRIVPIADKILPIFAEFVQNAKGKMLFDMSYNVYNQKFKAYFTGHTPHDTRATFISFAQEKGIPLVIIQKIVGHRTGHITGDVYTKLSLEPLLAAVNKL